MNTSLKAVTPILDAAVKTRHNRAGRTESASSLSVMKGRYRDEGKVSYLGPDFFGGRYPVTS